jgi:hypothetical protein
LGSLDPLLQRQVRSESVFGCSKACITSLWT